MAVLLKLSALIALASCVAAMPGHYDHGHGHGFAHGHEHGHGQDYYAEPNYKYAYGVNDHHTGDVKSATETRHGGVTHGSYSLLQPDGVTRTVKYSSDPHKGFTADVYMDGHLVKHEAPKHVVAHVAPVHHHVGHVGHAAPHVPHHFH